MKIAQLVTRNCTGGVQVVAESLDAAFRQAGNDASVWFFCDSEEQITPSAGAKFLFRQRPSRFYYPRLLWRLFLLLRQEKPDIVFAHTTNTAVPGLILAALAGVKKRVAVQHNPLDTYTNLARKTDELCANIGIYWRNIVVAETIRKTCTGYTVRAASRVLLIHNGLTVLPQAGATQSSADCRDLRRRFSLPENQPLLVTIGRLAEQKNQALLIEIMKSLPGVTLAVAGTGPLREALLQKIASAGLTQVYLLGALSSQQVRLLCRTADLFVTPSHFEAMPMVVLEAMQEGAVILASNIDAHCELLGDAGVVVPATEQDFLKAIQNLLEDPILRESLSSKAVLRAKLFSEEKMVAAYLSLLDNQEYS